VAATIGVILLIIAALGVIAIVHIIDSGSQRERGIPRKDRKKLLRKKKHDHEK
jgi:hypothetical protein